MTGLRVASFNIRNGRAFDGRHSWPLRRRVTASVIAALHADVLGLQEAFGFQVRWLGRQLHDYDWCGLGRDTGGRGERCPIFRAKAAASIIDCRTRWFGSEPDEPGTKLPGANFPRVATMAEMTLHETGARFTVANTHLDEVDGGNRQRSMSQLLEWIDVDGPCVVMGDFNVTPGDDVLGLLEEAGLRSVLPADAGGTTHNFTGTRDGRQLDHIFVSPHWELHAARIEVGEAARHRLLPSDHWPIVADIGLR